MKVLQATVVNVVRASTRYGDKLCLNAKLIDTKEKIALWSNDLENALYLSKSFADRIQVIKDDKNKYSLLDNGREDTPTTSTTTTTQTYAHHNNNALQRLQGNGHSSSSNDEEDILDLPNLSNVDKRKMMEYIRSQSKLLKFCYDTCAEQFPEMKGKDERGLRSLAITLLISANQTRDKYKK